MHDGSDIADATDPLIIDLLMRGVVVHGIIIRQHLKPVHVSLMKKVMAMIILALGLRSNLEEIMSHKLTHQLMAYLMSKSKTLGKLRSSPR